MLKVWWDTTEMSKLNGPKWKSDFKSSHFQLNFRNASAHEARPIWVQPPTVPPCEHPSDARTSIKGTLGIQFVFSVAMMQKMVVSRDKEQKGGYRYRSPIPPCGGTSAHLDNSLKPLKTAGSPRASAVCLVCICPPLPPSRLEWVSQSGFTLSLLEEEPEAEASCSSWCRCRLSLTRQQSGWEIAPN